MFHSVKFETRQKFEDFTARSHYHCQFDKRKRILGSTMNWKDKRGGVGEVNCSFGRVMGDDKRFLASEWHQPRKLFCARKHIYGEFDGIFNTIKTCYLFVVNK